VKHETHEEGCGAGDQAGGRECLFDVLENVVDAFLEYPVFLLLGVESLDDADAAQSLGEPAGHFGVDGAPIAEDRPDIGEGLQGNEPEDNERDECIECHLEVYPDQKRKGHASGQKPSDKLNQACADEAPPRHQS